MSAVEEKRLSGVAEVEDDDMGLSEEQVKEARTRLAELEAKLKEVDLLEAKQLEAVKKLTNSQLDCKVKELQDSVQKKVDTRMSEVQSRYGQHAIESIGGRQTDVLRMNKALREVSRLLPVDLWADLYDRLTSDLDDRSKVNDERERVEKSRPFMKAYNCLMSWKDQCGDFCDISLLPVALKSIGQQDLANTAEDILKSEGDSLFTISSPARRSGVAKKDRPSRPMSVILSTLEQQQQQPSSLKRNPSLREKNEKIEGFLGNRTLLKISKTFTDHSQWRALAEKLSISAENVEDVANNEDNASTCTFKLLFSWRDTLGDLKQEHVSTLEKALKEADKLDSVEALNA